MRAGLVITETIGQLSNPGGEPLAARVGIATGLVMIGELIRSVSSAGIPNLITAAAVAAKS